MPIEHRLMLMCPPNYFTVRDVKNPFMEAGRPVDLPRAVEQWNAVRVGFERAGVEVALIDPVKDLEDMVFAANQSFVGSGSVHPRFVVPSRMRYPSRQREVPYFVRWFEAQRVPVIDLKLEEAKGEYLEGHGDLLMHPGSRSVWAGFGFRSSPEGLTKFAEAMRGERIEVKPVELVDPSFYHLDTCLAPLNEEAALIYAPAFAHAALDALRGGWKRLHEVSRSDAYAFACNGVAVNGRFIASHISDAVSQIVREEGLQPVTVDTGEFEKAGGSVFCLKSFLD